MHRIMSRQTDNRIDDWVGRFIESTRKTQRKPSPGSEKTMTIIEKVALSLSDQHLLLGLAYVIAGIARLCAVSCYDFLIISNLAWISAIVHTMSLFILDRYFRSHRSTLRHWRLAFNTVLIMFLLAFEFLTAHHDLGVACTPMLCSIMDLKGNIYHGSLGWLIFDIMTLLYIYVQGACVLYETVDNFVDKWMFTKVENAIRDKQARSEAWLQVILTPEYRSNALHTAMLYSPTFTTMAARSIYLFWSTSWWLFRFYKTTLKSLFLIVIVNIFWFVYSVYGIISVRSSSPTLLEGNQDEMGFGQIVPVCLLLSILFVWREASAGKHMPKFRNT